MKSIFVTANVGTGSFKCLSPELKHDFLVFEESPHGDMIVDAYTPGGYTNVDNDKGNYSQVISMWDDDKRLIAVAIRRDWDPQAAPKILKDILCTGNINMDFIATFCERAELSYEDTASEAGFKAFNMPVP